MIVGPRRTLGCAVALVAVLGAAWALVSPLGSVPDEPAHVLYAAAVVRGELGDGPKGQDVVLPGRVASAGAAACTAFRPSTTADCRPALRTGDAPAATVTSAGRYPPLYYALVGWPTLFGFSDAVWYAMRILSVLVGTGLLLLATATWRRDAPWVALGIVVAGTPMTAFMLGSVNPNGVEIVAGVAVVLAGCGVVDTAWRGGRLRGWEAAALASVVTYLALARPGSYVLAFGLVIVLAVASARQLLAGGRSASTLAAGTVAGLGLGVLAGRLTRLPPVAADPATPPVSAAQAARTTARLADDWLEETIGIFGWRDHQPPTTMRLLWLGAVLALLVAALVAGSLQQRSALTLLVVGGVLVAPFFVFVTLFRDGVGYQARYAMALTQAVPVLAGAVLDQRAGPLPSWCRPVPALLLGLGLLTLAGSGLRYAVGLPLPGPTDLPSAVVWLPPGWPLVLVLLALGVWLVVRLGRPDRDQAGSEPVRASTP